MHSFCEETAWTADSKYLFLSIWKDCFCDIVLCEFQYRVICVYAPNSVEERARFFSNLSQYVRCDKRVMLLGDFNCVMSASDRANNAGVRDRSSEVLSN